MRRTYRMSQPQSPIAKIVVDNVTQEGFDKGEKGSKSLFLRVVLRWAGSKKWGECDVDGAQRVGSLSTDFLCFASPPRGEGTHARPGPWKLVSGPKMAAGRGEVFAENSGGDGRPKSLCMGLELTHAFHSLRQEAKTETKPFKSNASSLF